MVETADKNRDVSIWDAFPSGIILPWHGKGPLPAQFEGKWALCDGTPGFPDLRNKFLKGSTLQNVENISDLKSGGSEKHSHDVTHYTDRGHRTGAGFQSEGNECAIGLAEEVTTWPPYLEVRYVIKL